MTLRSPLRLWLVLLPGLLAFMAPGCGGSGGSAAQAPTTPQAAATPTFAPPPGAFSAPTAVTLACSTPGAAIHFTLGESAPTAGSPVYTAPIILTKSGSIKAIAMKPGMADSAVIAGSYTITAPARPRLILYNEPNNIKMTPDLIAKNADFLDTMPFDGLYVSLGELSNHVMDGEPVAYGTFAAALAPMKAKKLKNATQNFALVLSAPTALPDFFDDWTTPVQNFANLARAARDAGLVGIAFDNEDYNLEPGSLFPPWSTYPDKCNCKYASTKTLAEYQTQVHARGTEIMAAMIKEFPAIVVVNLIGPYNSEPKSPSETGVIGVSNEFQGPLFVGFVEAAKGSTAKVVDDAELYDLRTDTEFGTAYKFRKVDIASDAVNSAFIPASLRPFWPTSVDVGFGLFDLDSKKSFTLLDVAVARSNITNALRHSDSWVWLFTEKIDFLNPESAGGAPAAWVDAVRKGKEDGLAGWKPPWPVRPSEPAPGAAIHSTLGGSTPTAGSPVHQHRSPWRKAGPSKPPR